MHRREREQLADGERFHVQRAASPQLIEMDVAAERRTLPLRGIGADDVDVIQKHQPRAALLSA